MATCNREQVSIHRAPHNSLILPENLRLFKVSIQAMVLDGTFQLYGNILQLNLKLAFEYIIKLIDNNHLYDV